MDFFSKNIFIAQCSKKRIEGEKSSDVDIKINESNLTIFQKSKLLLIIYQSVKALKEFMHDLLKLQFVNVIFLKSNSRKSYLSVNYFFSV